MFELLLFALVVVALVIAANARARLTELEESHRSQARRVDDALEHVKRLDARLKALEQPQAPPAPAEPKAEEPARPTVPAPRPAAPQVPLAAPAVPPAPLAPAATDALALASARGRAEARAVPSGAVRPPAPPAPPRPAENERPPFDWESLVGVKLFSWVAAVALALAGIFFLSYSIQKGWLQPPVRMAIGLVAGVGLLVLCELKAARRYAITANALDGAGIAILFSTFFAAHSRWHLVGGGLTFLFLVLVATIAVLLSIRRDSLFIALLGLAGGFATPALLSTGEDRPISLFGYLLLVNVGLAWVGYRKRWAILPILSVVFTTMYQWAWVTTFLGPDRLPLAIGIFLVFPIVGFAALLLARPERPAGGGDSPFAYATAVSATLPVLFAIHLATVTAYAEHTALLFGFLFVLDAGLLAVAIARGPELLHALAAASTVAIFILYFFTAPEFAARSVVVAFAALFLVFYLAAPALAHRAGRPFAGIGRAAAFAAPSLLFVFPAAIAVHAPWLSAAWVFGVLLLFAAVIATAAIAEGRARLHALGGVFVMATAASWSVSGASAWAMKPSNVLGALGGYTALSLFYLAVPAIAQRLGRPLDRAYAAALGVLATLAIPAFGIFGLSLPSLMAGAVLFVLVGAAAVAATPALHGAVAGRDPRDPFAGLVRGAAAWGRGALPLGGLLLLLFFVAPVPSGAPWPWMAAGGVILLAIGTAVLHTAQAAPFVSAIGIAQTALLTWLLLAGGASPPAGLAAGTVVAGFALAWAALAARVRADEASTRRMDVASVVALVFAQIVAIAVAGASDAPSLGWLVAAHVAFLAALFTIAARRGWHLLAVGGLLPAAVAVFQWQALHAGEGLWTSQIGFALAIFLTFLAYPLALGRRAGTAVLPYVAAVLASLMFFFTGRATLLDADLGRIMGALPVFEASLLAVLLVQVLRLEPPGARALGRLAFVAGSVLAYLTAAIPLQLEKEWITIGWALEAVALAWLYRRVPHRGLFYAAVALAAAVFVRLALNPEVLVYYPRGGMRIWNWYLYTYLVSAASLLAAGRLLATVDDRLGEGWPRASVLASGAVTVLLFLLLNIEIADFFSEGARLTFNFSGTLAQDLSYTLGWAVFAVGLLAVGIAGSSRAARAAALGLLVVGILKAFLHDLSRLGGLYRVGSFVGLAVCLALVAVALQKFVLARRPGEHR